MEVNINDRDIEKIAKIAEEQIAAFKSWVEQQVTGASADVKATVMEVIDKVSADMKAYGCHAIEHAYRIEILKLLCAAGAFPNDENIKTAIKFAHQLMDEREPQPGE